MSKPKHHRGLFVYEVIGRFSYRDAGFVYWATTRARAYARTLGTHINVSVRGVRVHPEQYDIIVADGARWLDQLRARQVPGSVGAIDAAAL